MFKLIRLEWKKNNMAKHIRNAVLMVILICPFIYATVTEVDAGEFGFSIAVVSVELFTNMSFIVFTGVMLASFTVNAYKNKTMNLMFSYPIKRQKIIISQMLAVWIFNFILLTLTKLAIYISFILLKPYFAVFSLIDINIVSLSFYIRLLVGSAAMISINYIALFVGIVMNSSKATIITSVLIVCFTQGNIGAYTLINNVVFLSILLILSIISAILSIYKIETKDLL